MSKFTKDKPTSRQLVEELGDRLDITICSDVIYGLDYEYLQLENKAKKYKEVIDKAIKCIDYNIKYRNGADIYQFVDIESEILEPLKFILELDEENGNAYLKEFNDWLKEVE